VTSFEPAGSLTPPSADVLREVLALTEAEAELAIALFSGQTLRDAARHLARSINTCKSQLKSIYKKTGSRTHTELAKCLVQVRLRAEHA
jgi:DNA-binding NarL/FixJ family response regulator